MRLVHKSTGVEVQEGDEIEHDHSDSSVIITGWRKPHKPVSSGFIYVEGPRMSGEYYPSVFNCEWIEREDRQDV